VLEDSFFVAIELARHLIEIGFEVVGPVASVGDAERLIATQGCDAAFLDVELGDGQDSLDLARDLQRRGIPFCFMTGYEHDFHRLREFEGAGHLIKPVDLDDAELAVHRMCSPPSA
jgi:DNA-binding response OmpR family regulator